MIGEERARPRKSQGVSAEENRGIETEERGDWSSTQAEDRQLTESGRAALPRLSSGRSGRPLRI